MKKNNKPEINALYRQDPLVADRLLWGRRSDGLSRRGHERRGHSVAERLSTAHGLCRLARFGIRQMVESDSSERPGP